MKSMAEALRAAGFLVPSCERKHVYPTEKRARSCANQCAAKRGWRLEVYHCAKCGGWHLTKRPQVRGGKR